MSRSAARRIPKKRKFAAIASASFSLTQVAIHVQWRDFRKQNSGFPDVANASDWCTLPIWPML
jgi:hypothetical protein